MKERSHGMVFVFWLAGIFGLCGLHRFYLGKPITGFLYLITLGFCGVGQITDLVRLDRMTERENLRLAENRQRALPVPNPEHLRIALVRAAAARDGRLSVTQGVLSTGKTFQEVELALDEMAASGHVDISNDPETGIVVYCFEPAPAPKRTS